MKFTKASIKDIKTLATIEDKSKYKWDVNKKDFLNHLNRILKLKGVKSYFLTQNKNSIAYFLISKKKNICYIDYFAVIKSHQGKGISKILLKKLV